MRSAFSQFCHSPVLWQSLEGFISHKIFNMKIKVHVHVCVYLNLSVYCILAKISVYHLQLKCMGSHFFPGHPYIESCYCSH